MTGVKVWNGSAWTNATPKVWNGSAWTPLLAGKVWNGSAWVNFYTGVSVSISPESTTTSGGSFNQSSFTLVITGGTPSSYNWYITAESGDGFYTIIGSHTIDSFTLRVDVNSVSYRADFACDVVIDGVTYTASAYKEHSS